MWLVINQAIINIILTWEGYTVFAMFSIVTQNKFSNSACYHKLQQTAKPQVITQVRFLWLLVSVAHAQNLSVQYTV